MSVHNRTHAPALLKSAGINALGQGQITNVEAAAAWIRSQAEGTIGTTHPTGATITRLAGDSHVGRQIIARTKFVADHTPHSRENHCRAGPDTGHHIVRSTCMRRLAMSEAADDGHLVGHLGHLWEILGKLFSGDRGVHRPQRSTIFLGREILGIKRFLVG